MAEAGEKYDNAMQAALTQLATSALSAAAQVTGGLTACAGLANQQLATVAADFAALTNPSFTAGLADSTRRKLSDLKAAADTAEESASSDDSKSRTSKDHAQGLREDRPPAFESLSRGRKRCAFSALHFSPF